MRAAGGSRHVSPRMRECVMVVVCEYVLVCVCVFVCVCMRIRAVAFLERILHCCLDGARGKLQHRMFLVATVSFEAMFAIILSS